MKTILKRWAHTVVVTSIKTPTSSEITGYQMRCIDCGISNRYLKSYFDDPHGIACASARNHECVVR